ncbi:MAG: tryptophan--tRNA ligase [Candidatus Riflebacteria bacterium]|nr:tryptophan--tRNA ligase [Candidatus Riflebacteria bacterium]
MPKKILVSGMRTTGDLHLGHLEGTLKNWVNLQEDYECYFFAAVWHAFTDTIISDVKEKTHSMIIDWLSVGLDPEKSVIFRQSAMPQHAELSIILNNFTPLGWLERCPTYKDFVRDDSTRAGVSAGKLTYPVLMTADIAVYKADLVPVGKDQIPHMELSREIIRRFNQYAGDVLVEPKELLSDVPLMLGVDNRKMSKSYDNAINLREEPKSLKAKIQQMITDPQRIRKTDPGEPEVCNVYAYHKIYVKDKLEATADGCRTASIGCKDCKKILFERINNMLEPFRQKRAELEKQPDYITDVLKEGEKKASLVADQTIAEVRKGLGLYY